MQQGYHFDAIDKPTVAVKSLLTVLALLQQKP